MKAMRVALAALVLAAGSATKTRGHEEDAFRDASLRVFAPSWPILAVGPDASRREANVAFDFARVEQVAVHGPWHAPLLSPEGRSFGLLSGNAVVLVDLRRGERGLTLQGHDGNIHDHGWSRDGRALATTGYDGKVRVYETAGGRCTADLSPHANYACSVALSSDGRLLATGGSNDRFVKLYEADGGRAVRTIGTPGGATYALTFTGDGRYLLGNQADGHLRVWRVADGHEVASLSPRSPTLHPRALSRDGRLVAFVPPRGPILVADMEAWLEAAARGDLPPDRRTRRLEGQPDGAACIALHPAGKHLAACGPDKTVRIWEIGSGRIVATFALDVAATQMVFTGDGRSLAVAGEDDHIRIYGRRS